MGLPQVEQGFGMGMGVTVKPVPGIAVMLVLMTRHNRAINMPFFMKLISFLIFNHPFFIVYNGILIIESSLRFYDRIQKKILLCNYI